MNRGVYALILWRIQVFQVGKIGQKFAFRRETCCILYANLFKEVKYA